LGRNDMTERWATVLPDAGRRQEQHFNAWLTRDDIPFEGEEAGRAYRRRVTRIRDAIRLENPPDRVPVCPSPGFFPLEAAGMTLHEVMYDYDKLVQAWTRYHEDFDPDAYFAPTSIVPGRVLDILDLKLYHWPGHGVSRERPYQFVEGEYMKEGEYPAFIDDPTAFFIKVYFPRIFGALRALEKMPPMPPPSEIITLASGVLPFADPAVQKALHTLMEAGTEAARWVERVRALNRSMWAKGYPSFSGGISKAPFDFVGDSLRGTTGVMTDLYRHPDELLEACERVVPLMVSRGVESARANRHCLVFMPLHKGADGFMSDRQFRTFYWPSLRKVIVGLINEGLAPLLFAEGGYHSRLEVISDLPRGKTVWWFEGMDMARAKETVGRVACIAGNVPLSLLLAGTPAEVQDYCRDLIRKAGRDGGFILTTAAGMTGSKPANVRAMIEISKKAGVYPLLR
jgi:hypothetical protein